MLYTPNAFFTPAAWPHQGFPHCAIFPTAASRRSLDRVSVPAWPVTLSGRLLIVALVGRDPTNQLIRRGLIRTRISPLLISVCTKMMLCRISTPFEVLSPSYGQIAHALLTRPPLKLSKSKLSTNLRSTCIC